MNGQEPILSVAFFRTASDNEPVREWLNGRKRLSIKREPDQW